MATSLRHYRSCKATLANCGIKVKWRTQWRVIWIILIIGFVAVTAWTTRDEIRLQWLIPAIFGAGVVIGSYLEGRSARHKASREKFYERLCIVNDSREKVGAPAADVFEL